MSGLENKQTKKCSKNWNALRPTFLRSYLQYLCECLCVHAASLFNDQTPKCTWIR